MILRPAEEAIVHADLRDLADLSVERPMRGIVSSASDALLAPDPEGEVRRLMGLPVCHARCSWISGLLAPPSLLPRRFFACTAFNITLRIKRSNPSTLIDNPSNQLNFITTAALHVDDRLLHFHGLQPPSIIEWRCTRTYWTEYLWTYRDC